MRATVGVLAFLAGSILAGQNQPGAQPSEGIRPRIRVSDYAVQARNDRAVFAASVLPSAQVKQRFAYDISKSYVVIEVACYPGTPGPLSVHDGDFSIRLSSKADSVYPAEATTVAAVIQRKNLPPGPGQSAPAYGEVSVGYENGTDPYTGRHVHTVYTGAGVGVGGPPVPSYPSPGGYPQDRALLEEQLWHRGLPEGTFVKPVAGYLYFPTSLLKKEKGFYLVEVRGGTEGPGNPPAKWELRVPLQSK